MILLDLHPNRATGTHNGLQHRYKRCLQRLAFLHTIFKPIRIACLIAAITTAIVFPKYLITANPKSQSPEKNNSVTPNLKRHLPNSPSSTSPTSTAETPTATPDDDTLWINSLSYRQTTWPRFLHTVATALPQHTWLLELSQIHPVVTSTSSVDSILYPPTVRLIGQTVDIHALTHFMQRLESDTNIHSVTLTRSDLISRDDGTLQFELNIQTSDFKTPTPEPQHRINISPFHDFPTLIHQISTLARTADVQLATIEPSQSPNPPSPLPPSECTIGALTGYPNLTRFLASLSNLPQPLVATGLQLKLHNDTAITPNSLSPPLIEAIFHLHRLELDHTHTKQLPITYQTSQLQDPFQTLRNSFQLRPTLAQLRLTAITYDHTDRRSVAVLLDQTSNTPYRVTLGNRIGRMYVTEIRPHAVTLTFDDLDTPRRSTLFLSPQYSE